MSDCPEHASHPSMAELLALPDGDRSLVLWIQRQPLCKLDMIQAFLQQNKSATLTHLQRLEEQGYLEVLPDPEDNPTYRVRLFSMRQRRQTTLQWVFEDGADVFGDEDLP